MKTYREVKVSERLPKSGEAIFFNNVGDCLYGYYNKKENYAEDESTILPNIISWLEEIEQPICKSCEASSKLLAQLSDEDKKEIIENGEDVYIRVSKEKIYEKRT